MSGADPARALDEGERRATEVHEPEPPSSSDLRGPGSEVEHLLRRASPMRLVVRLLVAVLLLAGAAVAAWLGHDAWLEKKAREVPMVHAPAATVRIGDDDGPPEERPAHTVTLAAFEIDRTEVTVGAVTTRDGVTRTDAAEALGFRCAR